MSSSSSASASASSFPGVSDSSSVSSRLQSRVSRLLSGRSRSRSPADSSSLFDSFSYLGDLSLSSSDLIKERRSLVSHLECRSIMLQRQFLSAAQPLVSQIHAIRSNIEELSRVESEVRVRLTQIRLGNERLMRELNELGERQTAVQANKRLVERFLAHFQLSAADCAALDGDAMDEPFFAAVSRVVALRSACQALMGSGECRIAIDLMDSLTRRLDGAYERLYRWVQTRCQRLNRAEDSEADAARLSGALALLRSQPVYFDHCVSEIAAARRLTLLNQFLHALTKGGAVKAIELSAHDPLKYATEILAWIHQAAANEREFLASILPSDSFSASSSGSLFATLGLVFDGVSRPIRLRLEQAVQSAQTPEASYRLYQILLFYSPVISACFPVDSALPSALDQLVQFSHSSLMEVLKRWGDRFSSSPPSPTADLNVSPSVHEALATIQSLAAIYQSSIASHSASSSAIDSVSSSAPFSSVFSVCFDPLFHSIPLGCSHLDRCDSLIAQVNFLHSALLAFQRFPFLSAILNDLANRFDALVLTTVEALVDLNWLKCGLKEAIQAAFQSPVALASVLERSRVSASLDSFSRSLSASGAFFMPQCDQIFHHQTRQKCRKLIAINIVQQYQTLVQTVKQSQGQEQEKVQWKAPRDIQLLLEVADEELIAERSKAGQSQQPQPLGLGKSILTQAQDQAAENNVK